MEWKLDKTSSTPLYQQIVDELERKISYGEYPPGTRLLPERKLAEKLEVNRMTVVHAYDELFARGFLERKRGSGTIVSSTNWGVFSKNETNWRRYVEGGSFRTSYPLVQRIREMASEGDIDFDLASGELSKDLFPTKLLQHCVKTCPFPEDLSYVHQQGFLPLRKTLASHLKEAYSLKASPSSILITSGAQQALYLITQCLLSPSDAIAIESPSYLYSLPLFQSAGLRIFGLPIDENGIIPEDAEELYREKNIRMIFLNPTYQNPTGTVLNKRRRKHILEIAESLGIPIVEDDPFSSLSFGEPHHKPIKSYDTNGNVLYIGSLSKVAASSLRIGWITGPKAVIQRLGEAKQQMDFGLSVFPQTIANELLQSPSFLIHQQHLTRQLKERRDEMIQALKDILGDEIAFSTPMGGLHIWGKLSKKVSDKQLVEQTIKNKLLYMPGSVYGMGDGYARFTFARLQKEKIRDAIGQFSQSLHSL